MNSNLDITQFLQLTASGLQTASFTQIRAALIDRYKEVYGSDIDLSTGNADGIFVNDLALIISNILQTVQTLYANLDVNYASGTYLDALCALSNVTRLPATYSNASLTIQNIGDTALININPTFIDQSGLEWQAKEPFDIASQEIKNIVVFCKTAGNISASVGWINKTLEVLPLTVYQNSLPNIGQDKESDDELRNRRSQRSGASGTTVLESLAGALYNLSDIVDLKIYNNNTNISTTAADGTTIDANSIYAILRYSEGITIDDSLIGTIIHEKLTPGIHSCNSEASSDDGEAKSYEYMTSIYGVTISESEQNVYWKKAKAVAPEIRISITINNNFNTIEFLQIFKYFQNYLNNLPLSTDLTSNELMLQAMLADPLYKGKQTYSVVSAKITTDGGTTLVDSYTNPDTYYKYTNYEYTINGTSVLIIFNDEEVTP